MKSSKIALRGAVCIAWVAAPFNWLFMSLLNKKEKEKEVAEFFPNGTIVRLNQILNLSRIPMMNRLIIY